MAGIYPFYFQRETTLVFPCYWYSFNITLHNHKRKRLSSDSSDCEQRGGGRRTEQQQRLPFVKTRGKEQVQNRDSKESRRLDKVWEW